MRRCSCAPIYRASVHPIIPSIAYIKDERERRGGINNNPYTACTVNFHRTYFQSAAAPPQGYELENFRAPSPAFCAKIGLSKPKTTLKKNHAEKTAGDYVSGSAENSRVHIPGPWGGPLVSMEGPVGGETPVVFCTVSPSLSLPLSYFSFY